MAIVQAVRIAVEQRAGRGVVVRVMLARSSEPVLVMVTARWIVSPAAMLVAPTVRRLPAASPPMELRLTVPDATDWAALVVPVKAANAAPPTPAAVRATRPPVTRALVRVEVRLALGRECFMWRGSFRVGQGRMDAPGDGDGCTPPAPLDRKVSRSSLSRWVEMY